MQLSGEKPPSTLLCRFIRSLPKSFLFQFSLELSFLKSKFAQQFNFEGRNSIFEGVGSGSMGGRSERGVIRSFTRKNKCYTHMYALSYDQLQLTSTTSYYGNEIISLITPNQLAHKFRNTNLCFHSEISLCPYKDVQLISVFLLNSCLQQILNSVGHSVGMNVTIGYLSRLFEGCPHQNVLPPLPTTYYCFRLMDFHLSRWNQGLARQFLTYPLLLCNFFLNCLNNFAKEMIKQVSIDTYLLFSSETF